MTGVGEFLSKAVDWVYEWWPVRFVREWEQGLRLFAGNITGELTSKNGFRGSGMHFFWPKVGDVIVDECNWEIVATKVQNLVTKDGRQVTVSFEVAYRIARLALYYRSIHDHGETIHGAVRATAGGVIPTLTWDELRSGVDAAMLEAVKKKVRGWGLEIGYVTPSTMVDVQTIRLITDDSSIKAEKIKDV